MSLTAVFVALWLPYQLGSAAMHAPAMAYAYLWVLGQPLLAGVAGYGGWRSGFFNAPHRGLPWVTLRVVLGVYLADAAWLFAVILFTYIVGAAVGTVLLAVPMVFILAVYFGGLFVVPNFLPVWLVVAPLGYVSGDAAGSSAGGCAADGAQPQPWHRSVGLVLAAAAMGILWVIGLSGLCLGGFPHFSGTGGHMFKLLLPLWSASLIIGVGGVLVAVAANPQAPSPRRIAALALAVASSAAALLVLCHLASQNSCGELWTPLF